MNSKIFITLFILELFIKTVFAIEPDGFGGWIAPNDEITLIWEHSCI